MMVYLDNSATTRQFDEVTQEIARISMETFGNPSSLHSVGFEAEKIIKNAKKTILSAIGADKNDEIIFTSGGTESNNLAILGAILSKLKRSPHIVTTKIEHPSVLEPFSYLEERGAQCTYLEVSPKGVVDSDKLKDAITEKTELISVMLVNNEIGSVEPIAEISKIAKSINPKIIIHTDAVQAFCKMPINVTKMGIDLLSFSGHKIHGPKGIGCLYVKKGINIKPIIFGGHQQKNLRSGTENPPLIGGVALATEMNLNNFQNKIAEIKERRAELIEGIKNIKNCIVFENDDEFAPHVINASFLGIRSETLLHALENREVYVSTGSACSSNHPGLSHVLTAVGYDKKRIDSAIRFSLSFETKKEDIEYAIKQVKEAVEMLLI